MPTETEKALRQKLLIARHLARMMSPWLYSVGPPPERLNQMFLDWIEDGRLPASIEEIDEAEKGDG